MKPRTSGSRNWRAAWLDPSTAVLIFSNAVTALWAVLDHWSLGTILATFWVQSVVIGVMNVARMMRLEKFSTDGFTSNRRRVPETRAGLKRTVGFFIIHYGFFHVIYLVFIFALSSIPPGEAVSFGQVNWLSALAAGAIFFLNHLYSFRHYRPVGKPNLGSIMFWPYMRIIPMHLTILFGFLLAGQAVLIFMLLKTLADVVMHVTEHTLGFERARPAETDPV